MCNAHRLNEEGTEAFILRLYRSTNRKGFVYGLTDRPQGLTAGFNRMERVLKSLFVRRLYLWPRFHVEVTAALEKAPPEVEDLRIPLSPAVQGIQQAIVEVMEICLKVQYQKPYSTVQFSTPVTSV